MSPLPENESPVLPAPEKHAALPAHASPASTGIAAEPPHTGRSWKRYLIISLIIIGFIAFVVWRIRGNKAADKQQEAKAAAMADRPIPVSYDVVQQRTMPIYLTALGTVTSYNTVTVKSRVDGQITRINFREGQEVKEGQLLIEIDPRPYQAALAQAQGNLVRDEANAKFTNAEAQRYSQLYQAGVVSKESAQTQQSTAGQSTGTLAADQAAIDAAKVNLIYTRITAPISGVVGLRQVDIGNVIQANSSTGLVVLTQIHPIAVIFTLPEDQLPQVLSRTRSGQSLSVEAWDRANTTKLATGKLLTVDNQIDTTTGTAKLKAVFDNHENQLFPNQFVNIRLITENRPNSIVIPAAAIQTGSSGSFVYAIDTNHPINAKSSTTDAASDTNGGGTHKRKTSGTDAAANAASQTAYPVVTKTVKIDLTEGNLVILSSGLSQGEEVVTDGQEKLKDGSKVIAHPASASQTAAKDASAGVSTGSDATSTAKPGSSGASTNQSGTHGGSRP